LPLLTELEDGSVGWRFYKHGAPAGAFADGESCEVLGPGAIWFPPHGLLFSDARRSRNPVAKARGWARLIARMNWIMKRSIEVLLSLCLALSGTAAGLAQDKTMDNPTDATGVAILGGGCFWCMEAVFQMLPGVKSVISGYAGGTTENPTYKQVCSGLTGHAEVIRVKFDPSVISYEKVLETFWQVHDPTSLDRQGPDSGTQYRSIILYVNAAQKAAAEKSKARAQAQFHNRIVTEIAPLTSFYPAEGYHQNFYLNNPSYPYCRAIIQPKVEKMEEKLHSPKP
jgi:peptide-methionine (S)-S-oxide reductase